LTIVSFLLFLTAAVAQKKDAAISKGNQLYKQKNFEAARQEYNKALTINPKNPLAHYNNGNTQFRSDKLDESIESYDNTINNSDKKVVKEKAFYNKGVAYIKQKKLTESIAAWKEALKLDPTDEQARENLQKALLEQKQQQQQQDQKKDNKQQQQNKPDQKPPPQQSKLTRQQVEQLLKAMEQKEKEIQKKLQKGTPSTSRPDKDW
jgi:Ca-activated chloride channel homolog